jgi:hypothetical protein
MMFPGPKLNTVFASRWKALMWAAGVLLTAYCSVPSRQETDDADGVTPGAKATPAKSPWALDPPQTPAKPAS